MRATIVLCEGNHDEVFIRRSLGATKDWTFLRTPVLELPTPFGEAPAAPGRSPPLKSVILTHHEARRLLKLPLREAAHPPLPAFHSFMKHERSGDLIALVRCHGDSKSDSVKALVGLLRRSINAEAITAGIEVTEYALAFVFDADDEGLANREAKFRAAYDKTFTNLAKLNHGGWIQHGDVPVGLFIFANDQGKGTLEDVLGPEVANRWPGAWRAADQFITDHSPEGAPALQSAKRLKARMTICGQPYFPGDPLSVVLDRDDKNLGLPNSVFQGPTSQSLVQFLQSAPFTP